MIKNTRNDFCMIDIPLLPLTTIFICLLVYDMSYSQVNKVLR